jgi:hypothetical protein
MWAHGKSYFSRGRTGGEFAKMGDLIVSCRPGRIRAKWQRIILQ